VRPRCDVIDDPRRQLRLDRVRRAQIRFLQLIPPRTGLRLAQGHGDLLLGEATLSHGSVPSSPLPGGAGPNLNLCAFCHPCLIQESGDPPRPKRCCALFSSRAGSFQP